MAIYISIILIYLLGIIIEKSTKRINRFIWVVALITPLFIISAFRAPSVGNDTLNYFNSYMTVSQEPFFSPSQSRLEIGYIFYMRTVALLGFDYLGFQIITTSIILYSIGNFIYKYSNNISFSFFIFLTTRFYFSSMNISRQFLAIAILLFTVDYIKKRDLFKFLVLVLIATSIHSTAFIFIIVYPLSKIIFNKKKIFYFIVFGLIIALFFDPLLLIFVNITGQYASYLETGYFIFENNIAIYINLFINFLFFLVAYVSQYWKYGGVISINSNKSCRQLISKKPIYVTEENLWYLFSLLTLVVSIVGLNATILSRIESYFSIFFLAFIPSVVNKIKSSELQFLITTFICIGLFLSFIVVMVYRPNWTGVIPHEWYWEW